VLIIEYLNEDIERALYASRIWWRPHQKLDTDYALGLLVPVALYGPPRSGGLACELPRPFVTMRVGFVGEERRSFSLALYFLVNFP